MILRVFNVRIKLDLDVETDEDKRGRGRVLGWAIHPIGTKTKFKITGGYNMSYQMADDAKGATLSLALTDAKGQPATPASPPVWTESSNGAVIALTVAADSMSATIAPVAVGAAQVNVTVEGDPTPGKDTQTGSLAVTIVAGEVANVVINAAPLS